jgi:hypothetical protein
MANVIDYPDWLSNLFTITNDFVQCEKHLGPKTFKSFFCVDHGSQICKKCKCSEDHKDCRKIFQLRKATPTYVNKDTDDQITITNLTIEHKDVITNGNFVSLNDIQDYSFNNLLVYYIFDRKKKSSQLLSCQICGHSLKDYGKKFCSLHCMVKGVEDIKLKARIGAKSLKTILLSSIASTSKNNYEGEASTSYGINSRQDLATMIWNTKKRRTFGCNLVSTEKTSMKSLRLRPKKQTKPTRSPLGNTFFVQLFIKHS